MADRWDRLARREKEIALLVCQEKTNKAIAAELCVSIETVKTHIVHILGKLEVNRRVGIAVCAAAATQRTVEGDAPPNLGRSP